MKPRVSAAALAVLAFVVGSAGADVVISETLGMKVGRSSVLALARFVAADGTPPFTNAQPPGATFRVVRAIRGCREGDMLRIADWGRSRPPDPQGSKHAPSADELRAAREVWAATAIEPPAIDAEFLLLLDNGGDSTAGRRPGGAAVPFPDSLPAPDARTIEMVAGLATFGLEITTADDLHLSPGQPIDLVVTLHNDSRVGARFEPSSLRLTVNLPTGERLQSLAPAFGATAIPALTLAAGEKRTYAWGLRSLFPAVFAAPGDYWLEIEVPAQGGERIMRHVEIAEASLDYACGRAAAILRTRVTAISPGTIRFDDPIYLRLRGERLPPQTVWPTGAAVPAAQQRVFVCGSATAITWVEPDGPEAQRHIRTLIDADSPDQWPRQEEADVRFAPPPDAPGVQQRQIGIDQRMNAP